MPYNALKYHKICDIHDLSWFNQYQYFPIYWIEFPIELNWPRIILNWILNPGVFFLLNNFFELNPGIFFLLNNFWIESWKFSFEFKIELNHFWQFSFESKIELNHFRAKFNHWLNRQIVPPRAIRDENLFLFYVVAWGEIEKLKISSPDRARKNGPNSHENFRDRDISQGSASNPIEHNPNMDIIQRNLVN